MEYKYKVMRPKRTSVGQKIMRGLLALLLIGAAVLYFANPLHAKELDLTLPETPFDYEQMKADAEIIKQSKFLLNIEVEEPISTKQWATLVGLQLADIYTTYRGLQYNCINELNPVLGQQPSISRMFFIKTIVLWPAIETEIKAEKFKSKDMDNVNMLMTVVVGNNYYIMRKAQNNCQKR